ncbi:MAG: hypothetical protein ACO3F5_08755, partial [Gemmatimonadaceae bacterium]
MRRHSHQFELASLGRAVCRVWGLTALIASVAQGQNTTASPSAGPAASSAYVNPELAPRPTMHPT